jgi:hypothetical protein
MRKITIKIVVSPKKKSGFGPCLGDLLGGFNRTGGICVSGKFISVRMGMGGMFGRECGFFHGLMGCMRKRMFSRMMPGIFQMTRSVLAGPCFERGSGPGFLFLGCTPR